MDKQIIDQLRKDPELLFSILKEVSPILYVIAKLNIKYLDDMEFGEIHITEFIQRGKIVRVEAFPKVSLLVEA